MEKAAMEEEVRRKLEELEMLKLAEQEKEKEAAEWKNKVGSNVFLVFFFFLMQFCFKSIVRSVIDLSRILFVALFRTRCINSASNLTLA